MKKTLSLFAFMAMLISSTWAYSFSAVASSGQTLYYNIISPNTVSVTSPNGIAQNWDQCWSGYTEPSGSLVIPSSVIYNGIQYLVTAIGDDAFKGCDLIQSVTIPNTVTIIVNDGFCGCIGLTSVTIPNSVTTIEHHAFAGCRGLTSVTIGDFVTTIGNNAFEDCRSLTSVTIGNSVSSIGNQAFLYCTLLTNITMKCFPPAITSSTFTNVPVNANISVPCGSLSAYQTTAYWSNFTHFVERCVTITTSVNDMTLGVVTGGGSYSIGDNVTLTAIPFAGARFIGWSNGILQNPLSFTATQNETYTAICLIRK